MTGIIASDPHNEPSTVLVNPPVSSPLHPQLNLPLLKGYLNSAGYRSKVWDSNIDFFHWFLGHNHRIAMQEILDNPLKVLEFYSSLEEELAEKSKNWQGLNVGLRSLAMKYDRIYFKTSIQAVGDVQANPFIAYYNHSLEKVLGRHTKIVGIAITFQDQIIPALTLANILRSTRPDITIVFGGQMITRCHTSMVKDKDICRLMDYMVLWDGEKGLVDIHKIVIDKEIKQLVNVIKIGASKHTIQRTDNTLAAKDIPAADFSDINFRQYIYPDVLIPFQTTRGCYAKCAFCAIPFGANGYKVRTCQTVVDDMVNTQNEIYQKYGKVVTYFKFMEDTSAPSLLIKIANEISRRKLDIKWETFARLEKAFAKPGMLQQLYDGGCRKIHWGLETNDPEILNTMNKKTHSSYTDKVLQLSADAGILNFCFVLVGFPGETDKARESLVRYITNTPAIHTITLATFDLTRGSPMEQDFVEDNEFNLQMVAAEDFQVRLPYTVADENWKAQIIPIAHQMMIDIIRGRPDIGFMTLFPDQIRAVFCEEFGNNWGRIFVERYGREGVTDMLLNAEKYAKDYANGNQISVDKLPEPIRREHYRTKEDLELIARAMNMRKSYEANRFEQV
jgi:radical SAM superfamily enzyme YgiQ (UPF0313 family)